MAFRKKLPDLEPSFVPISNVKQTTEIKVKTIDDDDLIKIEKKGKTKRKAKKPSLKERKIDEEDEESPVRSKYTLIITEKPQAALKIASALGDFKKYNEQGAPFYELERENKKIIVACAVGHLLGLTTKEKGWPIFNISWGQSKKNPWTKKYYSLLVKLVKNAQEFIVATDYDVEGEVIGWNIIRFIAKKEDAKRMKFSTLTAKELQDAYKNLMPTIDWGQAIAGETRHFLDWMYGINLSRALMEAIKKAGKFRIMSVGRVQGPALNLIVKKEIEIQKFKSQPYWQVFLTLKGHKAELKYEKDIFDKKLLKDFELEGKKGQSTTEKDVRNLPPQSPFDLTTLQREAYRVLGINPSQTLKLAQNLYLAGLISYPRTSSQKIPDSINPKAILKRLSSRFKEISLATRDKPIEGKKSDPAHPSIYPTGESGKMEEDEERLYNLIVKRFIACFCQDAVIADKKVIFICENKKFVAKGLEIKEKAWLDVYPAVIQEKELEDIIGEKIVNKVRIEEKETQPPHRFTPASIITELEKRNLGTKATRAAIVETLYNRNYIKEQSIEATPLGISLINTLEKYSPIIIDEKLTRKFEQEMNVIQTAKKNLPALEEKIIKEAKESIIKISDDFKEKSENIGQELVKANDEVYKKERENNTLSLCPNCKKGNLRILFNKKWKRYFLGCSAYPECRTTFSLPPNSLIKNPNKLCEKCNSPKLLAIRKAKRPWEFCFNPNCETNKEWQSNKTTKEVKGKLPDE
jgi:DNA topoisomerase-1